MALIKAIKINLLLVRTNVRTALDRIKIFIM